MTRFERTGPDLDSVRDAVRALDAETLDVQAELSAIPAPPWAEERRAARLLGCFEEMALSDVRPDAVGNVLGERRGASNDLPPLVVSAHLDTVFPEGTDVTVHRDGDTLRGPGISDDARGLAAMLTVGKAMNALGATTVRPVLFVGTVGEEGPGDLRGVKHLFGPGGAGTNAAGFISLDGAGLDRVVVEGLGSLRYRLTVRGAGGHSWIDWGIPNALHALSRIGAALTRLRLPEPPRTTLTLARTGGGTSINAIPQEVWLEIDTRSAANEHLLALRADIESTLRKELGRTPGLDGRLEVVGDRPGGATPPDAPLVRAAVSATRELGCSPLLSLSSTDANIPMSLGIPAVTLGAGGEAGQAHTTDEWYRNRGGPEGIVRALRTILLFDRATAPGD